CSAVPSSLHNSILFDYCWCIYDEYCHSQRHIDNNSFCSKHRGSGCPCSNHSRCSYYCRCRLSGVDSITADNSGRRYYGSSYRLHNASRGDYCGSFDS
ncbi:hypothetical protein FOZ62_007381, partial [Perkinsus olseni]